MRKMLLTCTLAVLVLMYNSAPIWVTEPALDAGSHEFGLAAGQAG